MVQVHAFHKCAFGKTAFELDLHHEILLNLKYSQFSQIPLFPFHTGLKWEKKGRNPLYIYVRGVSCFIFFIFLVHAE